MNLLGKGLSEEKRKSLELAEDSREREWKYPSFALELLHGVPRWSRIFPFPEQSPEDKRRGDDYLARLKEVLLEHIDPDEVDRTGEIPSAAYEALARLKAFAMKIPEEYGGAGLSQVNYNRAIHMVASYCGSTAVMLSAHQSIGVPQPLKLFGTEEQKKKYLPRFGEGTISAFALTEPEAGSDPRNMTTTAVPVEEGRFFLINGQKLWCTNGPIAGVLVVMAVTPPKIVNGKEKKQITAFIVETDQPGVEVAHRCRFMGLNGIQNGLIRFRDVKVPRENILLGEGQGLKLALMTLNTGRLTLPAASTGVAKWCLHVARTWSCKRIQWGHPIGEHEAIALKLAYIASHTFAMDALSWLTSAMADDPNRDIRLEAAIAKYFCTSHSWKIVDETLQIRGGQGYETASSLKARGMDPWPVERVMRDIRINLIIEGTSEIMHLFIAREMLDPHLTRVQPWLNPHLNWKEKAIALGQALKYYVSWYPGLWMPTGVPRECGELPPELKLHMHYIQTTARRLARTTFHCMIKYQHHLESRQGLLNRIVDIGTDLLVMAAVCSYAGIFYGEEKKKNAVELADLFCRQARDRINAHWRRNRTNDDSRMSRIASRVLQNDFAWLETDILTSRSSQS